MTPAISKAQIGAIHALKGRIGLDDTAYRAMLQAVTGKASSKDLSRGEAIRVIDHLKNRSEGASKSPRHVLDGPYAPKLRALWISAFHLGLARDRPDAALLAFVKRQTGVDHTRWLREPREAAKAIEGLKAWLAREGSVIWTLWPDDPYRSVVEAQLKKLGADAPQAAWDDFALRREKEREWMPQLGALIRAQASKEGKESQ